MLENKKFKSLIIGFYITFKQASWEGGVLGLFFIKINDKVYIQVDTIAWTNRRLKIRYYPSSISFMSKLLLLSLLNPLKNIEGKIIPNTEKTI